MEDPSICRICTAETIDFKNLYKENGQPSYEMLIMEKYLDPNLINKDYGKHLTVICSQCRKHLVEHHNFLQRVTCEQMKLEASICKKALPDCTPVKPQSNGCSCGEQEIDTVDLMGHEDSDQCTSRMSAMREDIPNRMSMRDVTSTRMSMREDIPSSMSMRDVTTNRMSIWEDLPNRISMRADTPNRMSMRNATPKRKSIKEDIPNTMSMRDVTPKRMRENSPNRNSMTADTTKRMSIIDDTLNRMSMRNDTLNRMSMMDDTLNRMSMSNDTLNRMSIRDDTFDESTSTTSINKPEGMFIQYRKPIKVDSPNRMSTMEDTQSRFSTNVDISNSKAERMSTTGKVMSTNVDARTSTTNLDKTKEMDNLYCIYTSVNFHDIEDVSDKDRNIQDMAETKVTEYTSVNSQDIQDKSQKDVSTDVDESTNIVTQEMPVCKEEECNEEMSIEDLDKLISETMPRLKCTKCSKTFKTYSLMLSHFRKDHKKNTFILKCCELKMKHRHEIEAHFKNHKKNANFSCKKCGKSFDFKNFLDLHELLCQRRIPQQKENCPLCDKEYATLNLMKSHLKKCHGLVYNELLNSLESVASFGEAEKHKNTQNCPKCNKQFESIILARQHLKICQRAQDGKQNDLPVPHTSNKKREKSNHYCSTCGKAFASLYLRNSHYETCQGAQEIVSQDIGSSAEYLESIKSQETGRIYGGSQMPIESCPICDKEYATFNLMKSHLKKCHGVVYNELLNSLESDASFGKAEKHKNIQNCPKCNTQFESITLARQHLKICQGAQYGKQNDLPEPHTSNKKREKNNHYCSTCGKAFASLYLRNSHYETCQGAQEIVSQDIGSSAEYLESCPICDKEYATFNLMKSHLKKCHGVVYNELLNSLESVASFGEAEKHKNIQNCPKCNTQFESITLARQHLKICQSAQDGKQNDLPEPHTSNKKREKSNHYCSTCGKAFTSLNLMNRHYETCQGAKDIKSQDIGSSAEYLESIKSPEIGRIYGGSQMPIENCPLCDKEYATLNLMKSHLKKCHGLVYNELLNSLESVASFGEAEKHKNTQNCPKCNKQFESIILARQHLKICQRAQDGKQNDLPEPHTSNKKREKSNHYCSTCGKAFASLNLMNSQYETCQGAQDIKSQDIGSSAEYLESIKSPEIGRIYGGSQMPIESCPICDKEYATFNLMKSHLEKCHGVVYNEPLNSLESVASFGEAEKYKNIQNCPKCNTQFESITLARQHLKICQGAQDGKQNDFPEPHTSNKKPEKSIHYCPTCGKECICFIKFNE